MKASLQLGLGQNLTMTPQLQQAIRLLQLSTLDLKQEIQDALDSNLMLETEEPSVDVEAEAKKEDQEAAPASNDANNETEINVNSTEMPDDLPVDTVWEDVYEAPTTPNTPKSADDHSDYLISQANKQESLQDHILWQMNLTHFSAEDREIALTIIDSIDDNGYFTATLEDIVESINKEEVETEEILAVLHQIQQYDPPGIAARGPQECILIQLRQCAEDTPHRIKAIELVTDCFDGLVEQNEKLLIRQLKVSAEDLPHIISLIRSMKPYPGIAVTPDNTQYVEPDIFVAKINGRWRVELNPEIAPKLRVNKEYAGLVRRADNSADNTTMKDHLQEAKWFIKSLQSRNDTLLRVASKIVEIQQGFFEYGDEAMKPLVLKEIAEQLELHESTISRVTTQKYMHTPRGTLEFKYFFSSHVSTAGGGEASATAIRALIKKLIEAEIPKKPLSDNKIAVILDDQGIKVARRTVAKYREAMAIPPSNERKRLF